MLRKKRCLDDDSEECEDDEECSAEYTADGADDDLCDGEVADRGEVEVRDDEEDDDSADCVDEEFESVPEEEEEDCRDCDGNNDHQYSLYHAWYMDGRGKRKNVAVACILPVSVQVLRGRYARSVFHGYSQSRGITGLFFSIIILYGVFQKMRQFV